MLLRQRSDSEADQQLKLKIRDALLEKGGAIFDGTVTADEAERIIIPHIDELKKEAETVVRENGCDYNVEITVGEEYFATRCYESFTMPAGVYTAVRVNIGTAEGKIKVTTEEQRQSGKEETNQNTQQGSQQQQQQGSQPQQGGETLPWPWSEFFGGLF